MAFPGAVPNFDRVARVYRWAEYLVLGPLLQRMRTYFLPQLQPLRRALVLGDGDGRFTAALLRAAPAIQVEAVDASSAMLLLLRTRCERVGAVPRLRTVHAPVEKVHAGPEIDVVVTHFFLDCLSQADVDALAQRFHRQLAPGSLWLLSDFGLPPGRIFRPVAAVYIRLLYLAFRWLTGLETQRLPNPQSALQGAGFERVQRHEILGGFLYTELWRLRGLLGDGSRLQSNTAECVS